MQDIKLLEEIKKVSQNIKIIHFGVVMERKEDPWKQLTGRIIMKQKISVEDMFHFKGFEDVS